MFVKFCCVKANRGVTILIKCKHGLIPTTADGIFKIKFLEIPKVHTRSVFAQIVGNGQWYASMYMYTVYRNHLGLDFGAQPCFL